jgi:hypothetical protein
MKRVAKIVLAALAMMGVLIVVGIVATESLFSGMCGNDSLADYASPDGETKVLVFQRDCGATTGFSTQASLVTINARLRNRSGNLFIADTDHGLAPSGPGGGPELGVLWESSNRLVLQHHFRARIFKAEQRLRGVEVRYEAIP